MSELQRALQDTVRQLLAEEKIEVAIGYESGTLPLRTTPCFIRDPDQVRRLVWNATCENNLATYLHNATGKVGIVAKGCDARSIVGQIVERQIPRENVVIIGVPCQGMIDRQKVVARLNGRELLGADLNLELVTVRGADVSETLEVRDVLCDGCVACRRRNAPLSDVFVGETNDATVDASETADVQALESWTADERWDYFSREFSRCIRCYACRQACPNCYCVECFVDQAQPDWFGKSDDLSDVMAFHLVRIYHMAGRCLDCGACVRACPMHIDLRALLSKVEKDVRELYEYEAGVDLEAIPPLSTYRPDDPQEFIK